MRLGVVQRPSDPLSLAGHRQRLVDALVEGGVDCVNVPVDGPEPPDLDVLWDPGLGMRRVPKLLLRTETPLAVTVHGLLAFALPWRETVDGLPGLCRQTLLALRVAWGWSELRHRVAAVFAVSRFGAREVEEVLDLPESLVHAIPHGVDHAVFRPESGSRDRPPREFLVVAHYQPVKNVGRILEAYAGLDPATRPGLRLVLPGYHPRRDLPAGAVLVDAPLDAPQLAGLYRDALALVAPSLRESFGMPLVEAMACGCPVLTADDTACVEITGEAALHVDPRSTLAIRTAMQRLADDDELRATLRDHGLLRAATFDWRHAADCHREVFQRLASRTIAGVGAPA